jgi:prepilin-type N-terminal cleavage/methylation domain-containing protein
MKLRQVRKTEEGFTLPEILVVVAISGFILIIAYTLVEQAMQTSLFVESHNQLASLSQRAVNLMMMDVYQAKVVYQNDTAGPGPTFLNLVTAVTGTTGPNSIAADYQLPQINGGTTLLAPDDSALATHYVGNCLLVLRQLPPLLITYNNGASNVNFPADVYRLDFFYLTQNTSRKFSTASYSLDLMEFKSVVFADYQQLNNLPAATVALLNSGTNGTAYPKGFSDYTPAITTAIDLAGTTAGNSFHTINANGSLTAALSNYALPAAASLTSLLPEFSTGAISGKMVYSVGFRPTASTTFPVPDPIPKFAFALSGKPNYTTGLEVKFVGGGSTQKGIIRLILLANYGVSKMDSEEGFVITSG